MCTRMLYIPVHDHYFGHVFMCIVKVYMFSSLLVALSMCTYTYSSPMHAYIHDIIAMLMSTCSNITHAYVFKPFACIYM